MKSAGMIEDVIASFFKAPVTQRYPFEKIVPPQNVRGKLIFDPSTCTGCGLCVKDCPSGAVELVTLDRAAKRFVLKYQLDRCIYCGQCMIGCKFKCITMPHLDWELASLKKEEFTVYYGKDTDIAEFLANIAAPAPEPAGE
jgi:formate hydrogenlyase subunit 6/NADH:ubiquinone oxidoreductase subunit I